MYSYRTGRRGSAVASIGGVSPKKGNSKYFNIYEVWSGSTVEIFKSEDGKLRYVSTSGKSSLEAGARETFIADQSRRELGTWTFVTAMKIEDFKTSGYGFAQMYCYK